MGFCIFEKWFYPVVRQIFFTRERTLSNTILIAFRHVTWEKASLPVDVRGKKRICLSSLICLNATKFVVLSVFTLLETICPKISAKGLSNNAGRPLSVDVCSSKTPSYNF